MIGSFMLALHLPSSVFYVFCLFFFFFLKKDGCMNVKDVNDKKLYMTKKRRNKRWVVLPDAVVDLVSAVNDWQTKRRLYWLPERCLYEPMMLFSFFFFFVQYFSYTIIKWNRCILKAQQIQNIIKEYDNITQNNTNKWWYFDILYLSWDLQATHETSWLFLLFSSLLLLLLLVPLLM